MDTKAARSDALEEFDSLVEHREEFLRQAQTDAAQIVEDEAREPREQRDRRRRVRRKWLEESPV